ncbi:SpoIIE family protein phosphatase [Kitasatospora sp. MAP5-34]|uniref:SpoIIE family protein phosphatase n=1 Tax=Kitasatospora sp. MAP5-34 TaxID=3035102 RepID=UPI0024758F27|nr:SpoIIE family protein phosphatase [Kitasatospora sp. MAP5-34]MDH6577908.1 PAS domain-containing protein [Kitasatospora sp. MAP5-34]
MRHASDGTKATRSTTGRPSEAADAVARDELLATGLRRAVEHAAAYGGVVYLRSPDRRSLVLSTVAGVPLPVLSGFRRIPVAGQLPASLAYRTGRTVYLSGAEETMRRFPRLAVGMPYAFASACAPVGVGADAVGAICVLWPSTNTGIPLAARRHLRTAANRLGTALADLAATGCAVEAVGQPVVVELPGPVGPAVQVGLFDWDLATGVVTPDDGLCVILGVDPERFDGRASALAALIAPEDRPRLRTAVLAAARTGLLPSLTIRVADGHGRFRPVRLWGRVPEGPARTHLIGAVLDTTHGAAAVAAVERLRDGVFALDPEGRVDYANRGLELLLDVPRERLLGRHPWSVLPWLADPVYEDRYRAAMVSQRPTAFLARRPPDQWLAFSLYPDAHGLTGRVVPAVPPRDNRAGPPTEGLPDALPEAPPVARAGPGAMYHLLQLASALTEAVSVREVCDAVADQIMPGFGGQELAIYLSRAGRMFLVAQRGYPDGFLDGFEGTSLRARLPGTQTLRAGVPIFFESEQELLTAYPGILLDEMRAWAFLPLIASGRPVGTCILGFDEPRVFTAEERAVLTGLGGLIAQALERARLYDAEFAVARGLQQALLPHRLPDLPGLAIAARYLPGTQGMEIGGDWYDAIVTSRGICLVIGDVEGHSVGAAAIMGQLRSAVRAFVTTGSPPDEVLLRTNRLLVDLDPGLLASCCLLRLDPSDGRAQAVRAGHLPPLLRHPDGRAEVLDLAGGTLLGVDHGSAYPVTDLVLPPGAVLALYTDGLVEEPGTAIDQGIDRLRVALAHAGDATIEHLADHLLGDARHLAHRADDVALLLTSRDREER